MSEPRNLRQFIWPAVVIVVALVVLTWTRVVTLDPIVDPDSQAQPAERVSQEALSALTCEDAGGTWDACGSACRGQDTDVCITVCAEYCECATDAECPDGFACGAFIDGVGVCEPKENV